MEKLVGSLRSSLENLTCHECALHSAHIGRNGYLTHGDGWGTGVYEIIERGCLKSE